MWVHVEPRITIETLVEETLKEGLLPAVVPEFRTITVGGAIMGAALESSSHAYGQFSDCALEYELVLGDGSRVTTSPGDPLFDALPGSYGTLGLLTAVKLRLIAAKPYVAVSYQRVASPFPTLLQPTDADFKDCIVISPSWSVVMEGRLTAQPGPGYRGSKPWSPWFYDHVTAVTAQGNAHDTIPIRDYLFRLDRGAFWMARYLLKWRLMLQVALRLDLKHVDKHLRSVRLSPTRRCPWLFRFLFGWGLSSRRLYDIWHSVPSSLSEELFFVQDFYAPAERAPEVLEDFARQSGILPIWLCPLKGASSNQFLSPHNGAQQFVNIGLYGIPHSKLTIPELTAKLEKDILHYGGRKMLYARTYYDPETFETICPSATYTALRKKFHADHLFPSLYEKSVL